MSDEIIKARFEIDRLRRCCEEMLEALEGVEETLDRLESEKKEQNG